MKTFLHFLGWALPYWPKLFLVIFLMLLGVTISLLPPWLSKYLVDYAIPERNWAVFWGVFVAYIAMDMFWRTSGTVSSILNYYIDVWVSFNLKSYFFRHLQCLSMTFLHNRPVGEHMYRANADIDAIMRMVTDIVPALIRAIYEFGLILLFTSFLDWRVTVLVLLYSIPYTAFAHWVASVQRRIDRDARRRWQRYDACVQEGIAGVMVVKAFGRQRFEVTKYLHYLINSWRQSQKNWWMSVFRGHTVGELLPWIKENLLRIWFLRMVIRGDLTYGSVFPILSYMNRLTNPIQQIVDYIQEIRVALIPAERILETTDVVPAVADKPGAVRMPPIQGLVEFEGVSFNYEDKRPILHDVTFTAKPGQKIGIVGHSGSGKSTVINLLLRLYDPVAGRVRVDGRDLREVKMNSYQQQIGLMMQDTYLFGGSIRANVLFGNPEATDAEIQRAAQIAEIHDWIMQQPGGYETDLSEGARLSMGQKQRLGLARALVRDPKLLILDEPTSSLDSPTEHRMLDTLKEAIKGRTAIWVTHRLNTIMDSDLILVVEDGRIIERGTHDELVKANGAYRRLWDVFFDKETRTAAG
jgi:ABC-type multidrug transport system fused ATPase/permease subunit